MTERLPEILQGWQPCNIWKVDETGQYFRALLNRSLTEASQICAGGKKSKDFCSSLMQVVEKKGLSSEANLPIQDVSEASKTVGYCHVNTSTIQKLG